MQPTAIADDMRGVFASTPARVAVVTTTDLSGTPFGLTCNSVSSVSLDPAMLLVCLGHRSRTLAAVVASGVFAVNFLAADAVAIARRFAGPSRDKFGGLRYSCPVPDLPAPVLDEAVVGWVACRVRHIVDAGDHAVVLGHARYARTFDGAPLMYYRRDYVEWVRP